MRAVLCRTWGPFENLKLEEVAPPPLTARGVRIAVKAAGVSFATSLVVAGRYQRKPPLPFTPGTEVAGEVIEVADGVTRVKPGDRVFASLDWGGQAEEAVAHEVCVHPIPDGMGFGEACLFPASYPTAAAALTWTAEMQPGESVLVHGAAGAVGVGTVECAKALGGYVIATAGGPEKCGFALDHGADHAIDYRAGGFREEVKQITGGRGVDIVIDPVGGDVLLESLRCLAFKGRAVTLGYAAGTIPQVPANIFLLKSASLRGLNYGTWMGWSPGDGREEFAPEVFALQERLAGWYRDGALRPPVAETFALSDFQSAMACVLDRRSLGKVVLDTAR